MDDKTVQEFVDHIENCLGGVDGVVVMAEQGQIEAPEGWVLVGTEVIGGKRIRVFELPKEES